MPSAGTLAEAAPGQGSGDGDKEGALSATAAAVQGYYKDLFMDSGVKLTDRTTLPAAEALGLSMEYVVVGDTDADKARQNRLLVSNPGIDDNGLLLYPDGAPRFRAVYENGGHAGDHGTSLGEDGRQRFRDYFSHGGSYTGSCAGAFISSLHYSRTGYINGPDGVPGTSDDYTPRISYFHIWPGIMEDSGITGVTLGIQAVPTSADHPFWDMYPSLQDGMVEGCSFQGGPRLMRDDTGDLAEMAKTEYLGRYVVSSQPALHLNAGLIAYKRSDDTGRIVVIGCHPEGATSGEKLDLMKAMLSYALAGAGVPRVKAALSDGEARLMNDNSRSGFERVGDRQYHHFTIEVPEGASALDIALDGDDAYDLDLFARKGDFAFLPDAEFSATSDAADERIHIDKPSAGTWYIGVKLYTTVTYNQDNYDGYYTGKTGVLNGVAYSILADWIGAVPTFADVPADHPYHDDIEILYRNGYTAGCSTDPLMYCPEATMNRAESAVFVERGIHSVTYDPTAPTTQVFADVALDSWAAKWINGLWLDGYTAGCNTDPLVYCPWQGQTRAEAAVFYMRMLNGTSFDPPQPTEAVFTDVALDAWYAKWVHAAYGVGLLQPCQTSPDLRYCPEDPLTRAVAAYMMVRAKHLTMP